MKKRAQGLPITTIVIAALGILVLVIIIWFVGTRFKLFGTGLAEETKMLDCAEAGGVVIKILKCDTPLLGNYGKKKTVTGKPEKLLRDKVCCQIEKKQIPPATAGPGQKMIEIGKGI